MSSHFLTKRFIFGDLTNVSKIVIYITVNFWPILLTLLDIEWAIRLLFGKLLIHAKVTRF